MEAIAAFDPTVHYLGKICKRGHDWEQAGGSLRTLSKRMCVDCSRLHEQSRIRRDNRWEEGLREQRLKLKFGITEQDYQALLEQQGGVCAICKGEPGARRLAVDHCHVEGTVRGLLCSPCNQGLGMFQDNTALLMNATAYLSK